MSSRNFADAMVVSSDPGAPAYPEDRLVTSIRDRIGQARLRAARHALIVVGLLSLPYIVVINRTVSLFGFDAHAYWNVDLANPYVHALGNTSGLDAFRYTPPVAQLFSVLHVLPWEAFFGLWFIGMVAALVWLTGRTALILLAFPPIALELFHGNIHLFMAVAIVLGFRFPAA